jgi:DNA-nicking Smr family endonuclease
MPNTGPKPADFGSILDQWEKKVPQDEYEKKRKLDLKKEQERDGRLAAAKQKKDLEKMAPQDRLDLHGFTQSEAVNALDAFVRHARKTGMLKVLVIHGKGYHSESEPVLKKAVRLYLEASTDIGRFEAAPPRLGGSGAVIIYLKRS